VKRVVPQAIIAAGGREAEENFIGWETFKREYRVRVILADLIEQDISGVVKPGMNAGLAIYQVELDEKIFPGVNVILIVDAGH
jgi:hypothetical protein